VQVSEGPGVRITLPSDVAQIDETGYVWTFLDRASEPERVVPGALIVAGDAEEPFLARVVDIISGPDGRQIVHLDVVAVPEQAIEELRHSGLLAGRKPPSPDGAMTR
jgi:hypothetical protein